MKKKLFLCIVFLLIVKVVHASFVSFFAPSVVVDRSFLMQNKNFPNENYKPYPGQSIKKARLPYDVESEIYMNSVGNDFKKSILQYDNAARDFDALTTFNMW